MPLRTNSAVSGRTRINQPPPSVIANKHPATPATVKTATTGWAPSGTSLPRLTSAKISQTYGLDRNSVWPVPKGTTLLSTGLVTGNTIPLKNGYAANFEGDYDNLALKIDGQGTPVTLIDNGPRSQKALAEFKSEIAETRRTTKTKDFVADIERSEAVTVKPFGAAGKLMSVVHEESIEAGGMYPAESHELQTFDATTGKRAALSQLLSPAQFNEIKKRVTQELPLLKGSEGMTGSRFGTVDRNLIDQNFAVSTDSKGNVFITVGWNTGVHADGGAMALFKFEAPTDAAFRKKLGL